MTTDQINSNEVSIPQTRTTVYEAIFGRRMSKEFTGAGVAREALQRMFDAAVWAPNHRLTEPWRFFVLEKGSMARASVAELAWQHAYDNVASPNETIKEHVADNNKSRVMDAPALVYAYSVPGANDETTQENYASVCCAIHNMALAAVAEGLNLDWSTGTVTRHPKLSETLGAEQDWALVGALFIGEAADDPVSTRGAAAGIVSWLE